MGNAQSYSLSDKILWQDGRSLLTHAWAPSLQVCRLINPVREGEGKEQRMKELQEFLAKYRFFGEKDLPLDCDSLQNAALLELTYRYDWEIYGSLAFLPSNLESGLEILNESNKLWLMQTQFALKYGRPLPMRPNEGLPDSVFPEILWDVILPFPAFFHAEGNPLGILSNPTPPRSELPAAAPIWEQYMTRPDSIYLVDKEGNRRPPFTHITSRTPEEELSVYAMILNADSKLKHALLSHLTLPPGLQELAELVHTFVEAIFYDPLLHLEDATPLDMERQYVLIPSASSTTSPAPATTIPDEPASLPASDGLTDAAFDFALAQSQIAGSDRTYYIKTLLGAVRTYQPMQPPPFPLA
ncbi:hypothetical protein DFH06DRAFT_1314569 [Mycena polygramma]|nr:hypothetical protein DFH06DRAFT_1314569 [Mycena polygramma]